MSIPPVSRRQFLATGSALLAATYVPDWAEAFQPGATDDARRAEAAEAALARAAALGASYADIRINRYRRESIATRERQVQNVSRSTSYGLGLRVLVNGAWGFAATNRVDPAAARDRRRTGGRHRPRQRGADLAKGGARQRRQGGHHLGQPDQARSVRGAARNQDRVPDEAERDGAGGAGRQLRQLADPVRRRAEVLRLERRIADHPAAGAHLSAVHDHRGRSRQRRFPDPRRRRSRAADRLRVRRGLSLAAGCREGGPRGGREAEGQARGAGPLRHRRRSVAAVPRHPRVGRPLDRARSLARLGSQHGGHQLPQADRRRQAPLRREHRQPGRRSHAAGRPRDDRVRRRRA